MKKWNFGAAFRQFFSMDHSEGPSMGVAILGALMTALPEKYASPELKQTIFTTTAPFAGYAAARFYRKLRTKPEE